MRPILICIFFALPLLLSAQNDSGTPESRCRYRPSREFILSKSDSCFAPTRREADRAFSLRCWDEAMALYRAAKSCADANQNARLAMNRRIQACRDSSEQELRDSEQQARRQFMHATAGNLAEEARELLKNYDRSLSYRLADFAGQYVAPGPNGKCLQALLDAWYYVPPIQQGASGYKDFHVPFCYQLDYDLGRNVQVRFGGSGNALRLYAFAPATRQLYSWDADNFEPGRPAATEEGFTRFDVSPDGQTLLFFSDKNILLRRGRSGAFRINAANIRRYCFSAAGDQFLYFDDTESKVYIVDIQDAYTQRKGDQRPAPRLLTSGISCEVLGMAYVDGRLWLGGRDSLVVMQRAGKEAQWQIEKSVLWTEAATYASDMQIFPERQAVVFINVNGAAYVPVTVADGLPQSAGQAVILHGAPLAIRPDASLVAHAQTDNDLLYLLTADSGAVRHGAYLHPDDEFTAMNGAFSPDGRWFSAATDTGTLKLWALTDLQDDAGIALSGAVRAEFSRNGDHFCRYRDGALELFATDTPDKTLHTVPGFSENILIHAVSSRWVAYGTGENMLYLRNFHTGKTLEFPTDGTESVVSIDDAERFVVYTVRADSLVVRSLENGAATAQKAFNGYVNAMQAIPGSREVLVVQRDLTESGAENQTIAKIWNPAARGGESTRTVRLHGYNIEMSALSPDGKMAAFSDSRDIRIFRLDNLLDENAHIRPNSIRYVTAMAFHPDGSALATGYDNGTIIVWDLASSEPRFHLQTNGFWIEELSFSSDGGHLRIKTIDGTFFFRDIDPVKIRELAQTNNRRLLAFTPAQIREYGLERALDYSGNFQRLAESRDLPLIRSFFEYYREQALGSNNIEHVKNYFESASRLYSKLDDPVTQRALRPTMLEIYENYIWKLLLRERNDEAARRVNEFNNLFDKPLSAVKSGAFTALVRNDLSAAARQFADWTTRIYDNPATQAYLWATLDSLKQQFRQLHEYNLLQPTPRACICGMYSKILDIGNLCPTIGNAAAVPFDIETRLRWNIFQNLYSSAAVSNHSEKVRLLQSALDDAKTLSRRNAGVWRGQLEKTALHLAQAYTDRGAFEQENVLSAALYRQALNLLDTFGTFAGAEPERLKALLTNHRKLGDYLAATNNIAEAIREYEAGLRVAERLTAAAPADSLPAYRNDRLAPLLTQLGMARLLEGNTASARKAFDQAYEAFTYGLYSYFYGHVALMDNNEPEALRYYGEIYTEWKLGDALFTINRLADRFPAQRARLEAFAPRLREIVQREHPEITSDGIDYRLAVQESAHAAANGRWADALAWNDKSLAYARKMTAEPNPPDLLKGQLLDAMLSHSFYLLYNGARDTTAYSKAIQCAEDAEAYARENYEYYPYREWIQTNRAHAYLLRNQPGDRKTALDIYRAFVSRYSYAQDNWELLQKDFRDLHRAGVKWPKLDEVIRAIKPAGIRLTAADWQDMGVKHTGDDGDQR